MTDDSIRAQYERHGVDGYYREMGAEYRNPHEPQVREAICRAYERWLNLDALEHVLDLACGSGEATLILRELGAQKIDGCDPYTYAAYEERTGQQADRFTFDDIIGTALLTRFYSMIVCSFALHLIEESKLARLTYQLRCISRRMLVLTPHKRPESIPYWDLVEEFVHSRVHVRLYRRSFE